MPSSDLVVHDATRTRRKARVAAFGPSGSGKTFTQLMICRGLAGPNVPFIVIDTEAGRVELYADRPEFAPFKVVTLRPPYSPDRYIEAIELAEAQEGIDVIGIDTISHEWAGAGGIQEIVDEAGARMGGNKWAGWSVGTPAHNRFLEAVLGSPKHMVVTMRAKTLWDTDDSRRPVKIGLGPIQRDGIEYEFDLALSMDMTHTATVTKSFMEAIPAGMMIEKPGEPLAKSIQEWLVQGIEPGQAPESAQTTAAQPVATDVAPDEAAAKANEAAAAAKDNGGEKLTPSTKGKITKLVNELAAAYPEYKPLKTEDGEGNEVLKTWDELVTFRLGEWFDKSAIGDLSEAEGKALVERLQHTKEKLDEEAAAAAPVEPQTL
jgi:hypothetical protein